VPRISERGWIMNFVRVLVTLALGISISTATANAQDACPGGYSARVALNGAVQHRAVFRLADLQARGASRVTISFFGAGSFQTKTYIGVPLIDLLNEAVVITDPSRKNDILRKYVLVRGSDCYESIIAVADLLPNYGAQQVLLAYATGDGAQLDSSEGVARLIVVGDKQGGRLVSNVAAITVRSSPSVPATQ